ncbi:endonuclease/exonuclease/phosphatase [Actinomadura xylanilytica]|uniref:endonuclease/exonuclease/phosphatase n=1 Tax=Actinomadura xylanilytica TaxID=887459 RepID=UPI00255AA3C3|nr:endonuclease/exonuclease/phosphatase [Actinomadura xylanilytica]MDL4771892.1 endonuclease/exonuclease/phosphatase [Actinomadura xylanilytica]
MAHTSETGRTGRPPAVRSLIVTVVLGVPLAVMPVRPALAAPAPAAPAPAGRRIHDVQGAGHVSPLNGATVAQVPGVVTAVTVNGFWMQDPHPDRDVATSEGVYVFTRSRPTVAVRDSVHVTGKVSEFRPGGTKSANLGRTEIDATATAVVAHGVPLPPPVVIGPGGRRPPTSSIKRLPPFAPTRDVEKGGGFDPAHDALDFYEALEGMRVRVVNAVAVGPSAYGEIPVLPAGGAGAGIRTARGGILLRDGDANPERVVLDDALVPLPAMNVGDRLPGTTDGVLDYGYGEFTVLVTATPKRADGGLPRQVTRAQRPGELAVATADLSGLSPDTPAERFEALAGDVVDGLKAPDLITVTGVQDNTGTKDDGTVADDQTVAELISAISAAGGPAYDWRSIPPRDKADGGEKGANERAGFLFRTDRGLAFVDRPEGGPSDALADDPPAAAGSRPDPAVTSVRVVRTRTGPALSLSPGRITPGDAAWGATGKPLAGEVTWHGRRIIVVAGRWFPKTGDDQPAFGRFQPPLRPSEWRRQAQAKAVAGFVRSVRAAGRDADVIVAGDLNEREYAAPVQALTKQTGLTDLSTRAPKNDRHTAVSGGNAETLDHILLSPSLNRRKHEYDVVHRNSEFAGTAGRRDPTVVRIALPGR